MADNVKVAVRVRPFNQREKDLKCYNIIKMQGPTTIIEQPESKKVKKYTFDFSYDSFVPRSDPSYAGQETVWEDIGVGVLANAYNGYNCSLFAYGQTGAGKSYSMMGYGEDKGIIPIASEKIFDRINSNEDPNLTFRVETSMLEIYMEKVRDLFNPKRGENLKIRNDPKIGFYVQDLTKNAVADYRMVEKLMETGSKARTVASTNMNATSSRAHTIFMVILTQTKVDKEAGTATDKTSCINLIDLAGSERQSGTGATGARLKEGSAINLSLSSLGNCIAALAHNAGAKKKRRVPYRDSVLTMLLKNSLGGNAKTIMIAAVSPASVNYDETLSTLKYADRAKQIKNKAVVNEDPNEKLIRNLRGEVEQLKKMLAAAGGGGALPDMDGMLEKEKAELKAKLEAEKAAEVQRLKEEFEAKMKKEMEDQWAARLAETEGNNDQNMADLAAMGVVTTGVTDEMKEKAASVPHIVNLNEDKQLNANIMYFFEAGQDTKFGRVDAEVKQDVKLRGLSIEKQHAYVTNDGAHLTLHPMGTAKTRLNGELVNEPKTLNHHDRLIFGNNHVFLVIIPGAESKMEEGEEDPDWEMAVREMNKAQVQMMAEQEAKRKAAAEAAQKVADARVAEIEQKLDAERKKAEAEAEERRRFFEEREKALAAQAEKMKADAQANEQSEELVKQLQEQEARLKQQQEEATRKFEAEQAQMKRRAEELEQKLHEQIKETERQARKQQREIRERSLLDEKLLKTIPLVNEANAISDELQRNMNFSVKLMANPNRQRVSHRIDSDDEEEEPEDQMEHLDTEVYVRVEFTDDSQPVTMWEYETFVDRLFLMRELYTNFVECGRDLGQALQTVDKDPFFVKQGAQVIGRSTIYLDSLLYVLSIKESTPIIDYKGKEEGELIVRIIPHTSEQPPAGDEDEDMLAEKIQDLYGQRLGITVFVDGARGLPQSRNTGVYVKYSFFMDDSPAQTEPCKYRTINPTLNYQRTHWITVTEEFKKYVEKDGIQFEVYGSQDATAERPPTASAGGALGPTKQEVEAMRERLETAQQNANEAQRKAELIERERQRLEQETEQLRQRVNGMISNGAGPSAGAGATPLPTPDAGSQELARKLADVQRQKAQADKEMAAMRAQLERQKEELANAKSGACAIL